MAGRIPAAKRVWWWLPACWRCRWPQVAAWRAVESASVNLTKARSDGKKSARNGDADGAWRQLNIRTLKRTAKSALECVSHSHGQVRDHFVRNPCKSLDRTLFAVGNGNNVAVVSVAWVDFSFTGLNYASRSDGTTIVIAETEPASGQVSGETLDAIAS
ncbi:hypothetical protein JNUCC0626_44860 [Lentzea sp. JNUCC 0626]|uniref:hypothetical protein n=1 Tax=Lentzea sp. JNUCC 0626 TaxID=3367513 RepID=UPI003748CF82